MASHTFADIFKVYIFEQEFDNYLNAIKITKGVCCKLLSTKTCVHIDLRVVSAQRNPASDLMDIISEQLYFFCKTQT